MNYSKSFRSTLIIFTVAFVLMSGCAGTQWVKEGVNQKIMKQDMEDCNAIAKIKARSKFPELLVYPSKEFGTHNMPVQDINLKHFTRAKIQYEVDCLLDKGYRKTLVS